MTPDEKSTVAPKPKRRRWSATKIKEVEAKLHRRESEVSNLRGTLERERSMKAALETRVKACEEAKAQRKFTVTIVGEDIYWGELTHEEAKMKMNELTNVGLGPFVKMSLRVGK